jgi:hypothetical protein
MVVRVDKCSSFGIRKVLSKSAQYLALVWDSYWSTTKTGDHLSTWDGPSILINMTNQKHRSKLTSLIDELMYEVDLKPLHPKNKILLYSRYVLSKLSWHFTVATISKTRVIENVDSVVNMFIRKWLEVPISGKL